MAHCSLLKEILDSLEDPDEVQFFAAVNGLIGDVEVVNRLRELQQEKQLQWENHIENLWQEVLPHIFDAESPSKKNAMVSRWRSTLYEWAVWGRGRGF
jgi:hypothetical protein